MQKIIFYLWKIKKYLKCPALDFWQCLEGKRKKKWFVPNQNQDLEKWSLTNWLTLLTATNNSRQWPKMRMVSTIFIYIFFFKSTDVFFFNINKWHSWKLLCISENIVFKKARRHLVFLSNVATQKILSYFFSNVATQQNCPASFSNVATQKNCPASFSTAAIRKN